MSTRVMGFEKFKSPMQTNERTILGHLTIYVSVVLSVPERISGISNPDKKRTNEQSGTSNCRHDFDLKYLGKV